MFLPITFYIVSRVTCTIIVVDILTVAFALAVVAIFIVIFTVILEDVERLAVRQVAKSKTKENTKPSGVRYLLRSIERRSQQTK